MSESARSTEAEELPTVTDVAPPVAHEVDHAHDADSALGDSDDGRTDTTSLASTIIRHREEWGRTYHKFRSGENDYWGPNDEQQNDQLDIGHHMLTLLLEDRLYLAPIDPSAKIDGTFNAIDLGCGTGIWAMDFADAFPEANVTGVDLSPIQPTWVPPNCNFAIDDIESPWTFPPNHFDFVHIRCLMGSIANWPALYKQVYDHMAPGAWIQHLEMDIRFTSDDGTVGEDHIMAEWSRTFIQAGEKLGKTFGIPDQATTLMQEAGFTDIHQIWYKAPVGVWTKDQRMKEIGTCNYYYCLEGCEGWALFLLTKVMQWQWEEIQVFIARFKQELNNRRNHTYYRIGVVWARKPFS